jgi:hypothetical protein
MNRKLLIGALAGTLSAGAAAIALAQAEGPQGARPEPPALPPRPLAATGVEPALAESFGVLRGAAVADGLSSRLSSRIGDGPSRFFGASVELSRVSVERGGDTLYVIPGRGSLCLALDWTEGVNVGCTDSTRAKAGYTLTTVGTRSGITIYGLVPDGVPSVTVRLAGGEDVTSDVVGNGYIAQVAGTPTMLSYAAPNGKVELQIPSLRGTAPGP